MTGRKEYFSEFGYWIEQDAFSAADMAEMFHLFYDVFHSVLSNRAITCGASYPAVEKVSYPGDLKTLDQMILDVFNHDKDLVGECYDIIAYSSTFLRFASSKVVEAISRELLGLSDRKALYGWTNRVRIDPPADDRRTYGWHQEVFYTIPYSRFVQTWCPVMRDTTVANGTIGICPGSHKEGIAAQTWHDIEGRATQVLVDDDLVRKYEPEFIEMKVGDVMFFDGHLFHRSGANTTADEVRFSLVGMWHDVGHGPFRGPRPDFRHRTAVDQKEYWRQTVGRK